MDISKLIEGYQIQFNSLLKDFFEQKRKEFTVYDEKNFRIFEICQNIVLRGGKRIRPIFTLLGYQCGTNIPSSPWVLRACLGTELMHAYCLVHDDIMDSTSLRRGEPTVHKLCENWVRDELNLTPSESSKLGVNLAILVGDLLCNFAQELLIQNLPTGCITLAMKKYGEIIQKTAIGQTLDLLAGGTTLNSISKDVIYQVQQYKTAVYTFEGPLQLGSIIAGAPENLSKTLGEYGRRIGIAFQIQDDILGVFGDRTKTGKDVLTDLREGKKSLLMLKALQNGTKSQQKTILRSLGDPEATTTDLEEIRVIIEETGSLEFSKAKISLLESEAENIIKNIGLSPQIVEILTKLPQHLFQTKF